jgi:hypothetical protein
LTNHHPASNPGEGRPRLRPQVVKDKQQKLLERAAKKINHQV